MLSVRLTPKANRDAVDGIGTLSDGSEVALMRVRAMPDAGEANAALISLLAKTFRRPNRAVTIVRGGMQRMKQVRIAGDVAALVAAIAAWPRKID